MMNEEKEEKPVLTGYGFVSDVDTINQNYSGDIKFSIASVAKKINIKGFGRNKILELLRKLDFIDKFNLAHQEFVDKGFFIKERYYNKSTQAPSFVLKATVKGLALIKQIVEDYNKK